MGISRVENIRQIFPNLASTTASQPTDINTMSTQDRATSRNTVPAHDFKNPEQPQVFFSIADATVYLQALRCWQRIWLRGVDLKALRVPQNFNVSESDAVNSHLVMCLRAGVKAYDAKWRLFREAVRSGEVTDPANNLVRNLIVEVGSHSWDNERISGYALLCSLLTQTDEANYLAVCCIHPEWLGYATDKAEL